MAVLGLTAILSGCGTTDRLARIDTASAAAATAAASTSLPDWPTYCRDEMPAVEPKLGEKARWTQKRWEIVRENENARIAWCAGFYDDVKGRVGGDR